MATAADIALRAARYVMDVMSGTATDGTTSSLTDSTNLTLPNAYFDRGTIWLQSGTHIGRALVITSHIGNKVTFGALSSVVAAGVHYSIARGAYPLAQIFASINQALDETHVDAEDDTLVGDGETLRFTLPAGVHNVKRVEFERSGYNDMLISTHWRENNGILVFDNGYAPVDDDIIHIIYMVKHDLIAAWDDDINTDINDDWLVLKTAERLLWWGVGVYGQQSEYRIEERMNMVVNALKGKRARREVDLLLHHGGMI